MRSWLLLPTLLLLTAALHAPSDHAETAGGYGHWVGEDPGEWPRVALVNRIRYADSSHPMAGSAFLLDSGGEIVAVTAKHVLRYFKSEAMDSVSFRGTLVKWEMFPKDEPANATKVGVLINENAEEPLDGIRVVRDWLLFTVEQASEGVTPLRLRETPLKTGEPVFVVGWRYTDEGRQHVYRGNYVRSEQGSVLIDVKKLADNTIPGLSGAPVIDSRGYVIGIMSSKAGKLQRLASIDYPKSVLEQAHRPAIKPKTAATRADARADCVRRMAEHFKRSGWIGVTPEIDAEGVITVVRVFADSPAAKAGMRKGDTIRGLNGIPRDGDHAAFKAAYDSLRPGATVVFDLERDAERLSVEVLVSPIPESILTQWTREECP